MLSIILWYLFALGLVLSFFACSGYARNRKDVSLNAVLVLMLITFAVGIAAILVTRWG